MNIIFDIDDTLYDQKDTFERAYNEVFDNRFNLPIEKLFVRSRIRSDEVFDMVSEGRLSKEEMYAYRISKAFEDCGETIEKEDAFAFQSAYANNQSAIMLLPGIVSILDELHSIGTPMGVLTNGPGEHQRKKVASLGLLKWFDEQHIYISGEIGCAKPSLEAFRYVESDMGISPENSLYIGDAFYNDVVGAKQAGWHCIWVNRRNNNLPEDMSVVPDHIIHNEIELMKVLKKNL